MKLILIDGQRCNGGVKHHHPNQSGIVSWGESWRKSKGRLRAGVYNSTPLLTPYTPLQSWEILYASVTFIDFDFGVKSRAWYQYIGNIMPQ